MNTSVLWCRVILLASCFCVFCMGALAEDNVAANVMEGDVGLAQGLGVDLATGVASNTMSPPGRPRRPWGFSVGGKLHGVLESDIDDGGQLGFSRQSVSLGVMRMLPEKRFVGFRFDQEWAHYNFSGEQNQELSDGFQDVNTTRFGINIRSPINDRWSIFGSGDLSFSVARGVALREGAQYGGVMSFTRRVNDRFAWSIAVVAQERLDEGILILAFPGVDWDITERLKLRSRQGYVLSYEFDEKARWIADTSLLIERREFKPDPDGPLAEDVVTDWRFPLELGLSYKPNPGMSFRVYGGVVAFQRFNIRRDDGTVLSPKTDAAPFAGLEANLRF